MASNPCPNKVDCECLDFPIRNFTQEGPEPPFIGISVVAPIPPINRTWTALGCKATCDSDISQDDADDCARRQAQFCVSPPCPVPPCDIPPLFCSDPMVGTFVCPDGSIYFFPLAAGAFCELNLEQANAEAQSAANNRARENHFCLNVPCLSACLLEAATFNIGIVGGTGPFSPELWDGSIPAGMTLLAGLRDIRLSGTPTISGDQQFTLKISDGVGGYLIRRFTVNVLQITPSTLPAFTTGAAYSQQMGVVGGSGNYAWKITNGSLPTGITMTIGGLISGTPTSSVATNFTVQVIDLTCEAINKTFFPPRVSLVGHSSHAIATILGYPEYIPSTPPKKYKKWTISGTREQIGRVCSNLTSPLECSGTLTQVSGARYEFSGANEINDQGQQISRYQQLLYAQCFPNRPAWGTSWPAVVAGFPNFTITTLVGYCWPSDPLSCPTCEIDFTLLGDISNNTIFPVNDFVPVPGATTATSRTSVGTEKRSVVLDPRASGFPQPNFATGFNVSGSAPAGPVVGTTTVLGGVVGIAFGGGFVFNSASPISLPAIDTGSNIVAAIGGSGSEEVNFEYILGGSLAALVFGERIAIESGIPLEIALVTSTANVSAVLSDEYTDAIALANALRFMSNGLVAENRPRTTGFVSRFTSVIFDLQCANLLPGESYVATVELWTSAGARALRSYTFAADATTHTVSDILPTPAAQQTIQVRNPTLRFA